MALRRRWRVHTAAPRLPRRSVGRRSGGRFLTVVVVVGATVVVVVGALVVVVSAPATPAVATLAAPIPVARATARSRGASEGRVMGVSLGCGVEAPDRVSGPHGSGPPGSHVRGGAIRRRARRRPPRR